MLRRNRKPLSEILASCFSKIKKPNKYCLGNQTKFLIFLRNNRDCMDCRSIQSKKELVFLYVGFIGDQFFYIESPRYFLETIVTVRYSYKINFPTTTTKNDTTAQLYCTLSTYVTPKTISPQNQKN